MQTRSHNSHNTNGDGCPPPSTQQKPKVHLTKEALKTLMEETATRAVAEAVIQFIASQQHSSAAKTANSDSSSTPVPEKGAGKKITTKANGETRGEHEKKMENKEVEVNSHAHRALFIEAKAMKPTPGHGSRILNEEKNCLAILPARRSPFTTAILIEALPKGIKIANLPEFDGTKDPQDYLDKFYAKADLYDISDAAYCKIFRTILAGHALSWFNKLPLRTIGSLKQLTQRFLHQFSINKKYPKTAAYLSTVVQTEGESLREYVRRFTQVVNEVPHVNHDLLSGIMQQNLRHRKFKESIAGKPPSTLEELLERVEKYIRIEESIEPPYLAKRKRDNERHGGRREEEKRKAQNHHIQYTPLNARLSDIRQFGLVELSECSLSTFR